MNHSRKECVPVFLALVSSDKAQVAESSDVKSVFFCTWRSIIFHEKKKKNRNDMRSSASALSESQNSTVYLFRECW